MLLTVKCKCGEELIAKMDKRPCVPATRPEIIVEPCIQCQLTAKNEALDNLEERLLGEKK